MFYAEDNNSNELYHFGVKGLKWGIRRYQNKDGTLTPKGRARASKQYKKYMSRAAANVETSSNWMKGYNRAADKMNNGLTDRYNSEYDKRLGSKAKNHDYLNDDAYNNGYEDLFDSVLNKEVASVKLESYRNDKNYKKAQTLVKKYKMESFENLVKENNDYISELKKAANDKSDPVKKALKTKPKPESKPDVKKLVKDYDMSDPDSEEALAILREIEKDL